MELIINRKFRVSRFITFAGIIAILAIVTLPGFGHPAAAAGGQYVDTTDDFYIYTPEAYQAKSCYPSTGYSSFDVSRVTWENVSGNYIFNITFQDTINVSELRVALHFFIDGSYASAADIAPYEFEESFMIDMCPEWSPRCCYNYTYQKYFYSVHVHNGVTLEMNLSTTQTYILDPIQNKLPMEQWFFVGMSTVVLDGAMGHDYINWPRRFTNDQLWLTYDPYYWHKIIAAGAAALGVIIVLTIVFLKKRKQKKENPPAASQNKKTT